MKLTFGTVLGIILLLSMIACHPYGDTAKDLGMSKSDVSRSGLVRTWISTSGNVFTIGSDSTIREENCYSQDSRVTYVSQQSECSGGSRCGSFAFTIVSSGNYIAGCLRPGDYVCTFITLSSDNNTYLNCSNSATSFQYRGM